MDFFYKNIKKYLPYCLSYDKIFTVTDTNQINKKPMVLKIMKKGGES